MTLYLGKVSCDLHNHASRVRVQIDSYDTNGLPLSVRASLNSYPRPLFKKGVVVEVVQHGDDGRFFLVTQVFEPVRKTVHIKFDFKVPDAEGFRKDQSMNTMSHDRVRFFLDDCYYNSGSKKDAMGEILKKAFDLGQGHSASYMKGKYGGFFIICRPSQFARFMIYRNEAGQKNGFVDLQVKLYVPEPKLSPYEALAKKTNMSHEIEGVERVVKAMGLSRHEVESALEDHDGLPEIDVSTSKHNPSMWTPSV